MKSANEANFRELSYKQEYLKLHKSVEKLESEKLEDMLNDFLSGVLSYASKPESWKGRYGAEAMSYAKRENVEEKEREG